MWTSCGNGTVLRTRAQWTTGASGRRIRGRFFVASTVRIRTRGDLLERICESFVWISPLAEFPIVGMPGSFVEPMCRTFCGSVRHEPLMWLTSIVILFGRTPSSLSSWKWSVAKCCHPLVSRTRMQIPPIMVLSRSGLLLFPIMSFWTLGHRKSHAPFTEKSKIPPSSPAISGSRTRLVVKVVLE